MIPDLRALLVPLKQDRLEAIKTLIDAALYTLDTPIDARLHALKAAFNRVSYKQLHANKQATKSPTTGSQSLARDERPPGSFRTAAALMPQPPPSRGGSDRIVSIRTSRSRSSANTPEWLSSCASMRPRRLSMPSMRLLTPRISAYNGTTADDTTHWILLPELPRRWQLTPRSTASPWPPSTSNRVRLSLCRHV